MFARPVSANTGFRVWGNRGTVSSPCPRVLLRITNYGDTVRCTAGVLTGGILALRTAPLSLYFVILIRTAWPGRPCHKRQTGCTESRA